MDYIKRLDNYDGQTIAQECVEFGLFEEAFEIYRKQNFECEALNVLLTHLGDVVRGAEFAEKINSAQVWSQLGHAYLNQGKINQALDCYLKCNECNTFGQVIGLGESQADPAKFVAYLLMARQQVKDQVIDNALCYVYAKQNQLNELAEMLKGPNSADVQRVGDRCYDDKLYEAAKILFINVKNNAKIASCLVRLGQYQQAIDSAKKANSPKTWQELCFACVDAEEFSLAGIAGLNIIVHPDHLEEIIVHYENKGCPEHMIELLQEGM
jgi:clathrin heavy chain